MRPRSSSARTFSIAWKNESWGMGGSPRGPEAHRSRVALERRPRRLTVALGRLSRRLLEVRGEDAHHAPLAVGLEVEPRHQALAGEHGQAVVAVETLGSGLEDLEQGVEAEEADDALAVPEHGVERREEHADIGPGPGALEAGGQLEVSRADPAGDGRAVPRLRRRERARDHRALLLQ